MGINLGLKGFQLQIFNLLSVQDFFLHQSVDAVHHLVKISH